MALRIRLRRMGRRNAPTYRIVVAEALMPRDGRLTDSIGHYNPRTEPATLVVDRAKALYWISNGATPTETVKALLKKAGVFRPEEPSAVEATTSSVVDTAKETVKGAARAVAGAVKSAASAAADVVRGGGEEADAPTAEATEVRSAEAPAAEAPAAEAPAAEAPAAGAPAAESTDAPADEATSDSGEASAPAADESAEGGAEAATEEQNA